MAKSKRIKRWPVVFDTLEVPEKAFIPILKEELQPVADWFHRLITDYLKAHHYPLRRGQIGEAQSENGFRNEDTARLWPGEKHLWESQAYGVRKVVRELSVRVSHFNTSPHAKFFFREIKRHPIAATENSRLKFWAGLPLPWNPPADGRKPGKRAYRNVDHPGHMDYSMWFYNLNKSKRDKMYQEGRNRAVNRWVNKLGE